MVVMGSHAILAVARSLWVGRADGKTMTNKLYGSAAAASVIILGGPHDHYWYARFYYYHYEYYYHRRPSSLLLSLLLLLPHRVCMVYACIYTLSDDAHGMCTANPPPLNWVSIYYIVVAVARFLVHPPLIIIRPPINVHSHLYQSRFRTPSAVHDNNNNNIIVCYTCD